MNFCVPKQTRTYADTLRAIGLAHLLSELNDTEAEITDAGSEFRIELRDPRAPEEWLPPSPGYMYIWDSQSKKKDPKPAGDALDYRAQIEKRNAARQRSDTSRQVRRNVESALQDQGMVIPDEPAPELLLATILASMRMGWDRDRQLYRWIEADRFRALAWAKHNLGVDDAPVRDPEWSNTQFLNPIGGKGVHSTKTRAQEAKQFPSTLCSSFQDWTRLRAVFGTVGAMLASRDRDSGDFKLFVIEPAHATVAAVGRISAGLRQLNLGFGVRMDIHAVLRCTEELIARSDVMEQGPVLLKGRYPVGVIGGLRQAYFKSVGKAAALMNDVFFPLPDWFAIHTREDATKMLEIIEEFIGSRDKPGGCLVSLQERNSDDCAILQVFRDWLSSGSLHDLLCFHGMFAVHVMQKRARHKWARPFSSENLTFLLTERYDMKEVVSSPGFLSIARAIRNATIYSVGEGAPSQVTTRFGLAQEWKQKLRAGKAEFLGAVAEFVQQYNWEVINRFSRKYHVVQTQDLDELTRLLESDHDTEVVGMLLLAYGYAQAPKTEASALAQGAN